jgi:hypothetical protein
MYNPTAKYLSKKGTTGLTEINIEDTKVVTDESV